jgi:hypothetical protein
MPSITNQISDINCCTTEEFYPISKLAKSGLYLIPLKKVVLNNQQEQKNVC